MECIEARALKSSFLSQMAMKPKYQGFYNDDVWCFTGVNNGVPEDFPVEDLLNLDFSDKELQETSFIQQEDEQKDTQNIISNDSSSVFSGADEFDSLSAGELSVPVDELENLEWLSQFVDDSSSGFSLLCPAAVPTQKTGGNSVNCAEPVNRASPNIHVPCFPSPVPGKPRSKRSRGSGRRWPVASLPPTTTESSSTSSSSYGSSTLFPFLLTNAIQDADWFSSVEKPAAKKLKRKPDSDCGLVPGRRCTHCLVQKTPQWRTGPLGPKTLCNACGVRFKSGRLFPEYRPACSPTFSQEMHSNSHRKVLEMRRKKETVEMTGMPVSGLAQVVPSF